jgi:hypothetical protein
MPVAGQSRKILTRPEYEKQKKAPAAGFANSFNIDIQPAGFYIDAFRNGIIENPIKNFSHL